MKSRHHPSLAFCGKTELRTTPLGSDRADRQGVASSWQEDGLIASSSKVTGQSSQSENNGGSRAKRGPSKQQGAVPRTRLKETQQLDEFQSPTRCFPHSMTGNFHLRTLVYTTPDNSSRVQTQWCSTQVSKPPYHPSSPRTRTITTKHARWTQRHQQKRKHGRRVPGSNRRSRRNKISSLTH